MASTYRQQIALTAESLMGHPVEPRAVRCLEAWMRDERIVWPRDHFTSVQWTHAVAQACTLYTAAPALSERLADSLGVS